MRVVLCDEDAILREMVEGLIARVGHELIGVADTTADAVGLIEAGRPDAVVFDMSLGYNTDFDVIESAIQVGAKTVVFSHNADDAILSQYSVRPTVVHKPDVEMLEQVLRRLEVDDQHRVVETDRRVHPTREVNTPAPTGVVDAAAFYEALNEAIEGDALVSVESPDEGSTIAERLITVMRGGDRLLATSTSVRVFLLGGGDQGVASFVGRLAANGVLPDGSVVTSVIVAPGESPTDAFDRLKVDGRRHELA